MPFVVNEPTLSNGTQTMNHQHAPGHDCSKCTKPTCPSNILPPTEPLVNVGRSDDQSEPAGKDDLRHPSRLFQNDGETPLMPSPALVDDRYDGGASLRSSDGQGSHDAKGQSPAHPTTYPPML